MKFLWASLAFVLLRSSTLSYVPNTKAHLSQRLTACYASSQAVCGNTQNISPVQKSSKASGVSSLPLSDEDFKMCAIQRDPDRNHSPTFFLQGCSILKTLFWLLLPKTVTCRFIQPGLKCVKLPSETDTQVNYISFWKGLSNFQSESKFMKSWI